MPIALKTSRLRSLCRRLAAARSGHAAVELALVAPILLALVFGILDIGLLVYSSAAIDNAGRLAARQIRTGQVQTSGNPMNTFQAKLCDALTHTVLTCAQASFDVRTFTSFTTVSLPAPTFNANGQMNGTQFVPGTPGSIVAVRVTYPYTFHAPFIGMLLNGSSPTQEMLLTTVVFRNEPYPVG